MVETLIKVIGADYGMVGLIEVGVDVVKNIVVRFKIVLQILDGFGFLCSDRMMLC